MGNLFKFKSIDDLVVVGGEFLRAACVRPDVMLLLIRIGYSDAEHQKGWSMFLKVLGHRQVRAASVTRSSEEMQALTQVEQFESSSFRRATAALIRAYPDQYDYIFSDGLAPQRGLGATDYALTFLDRYAALRDGTDANRDTCRAADRAAARLLEGHHVVSPEVEGELRHLIAVARAEGLAHISVEIDEWDTSEPLMQAASDFAEWLRQWQTRVTSRVYRRDVRAMLGLRSDQRGSDPTEFEPDMTLTLAGAV